MAALENANAGLPAENVELANKEGSERATLRQELQMKIGSKILQTKTVARHTAIGQSLITNIASLFSEEGISRKRQNDAEFMQDGAKVQETLLAALKIVN